MKTLIEFISSGFSSVVSWFRTARRENNSSPRWLPGIGLTAVAALAIAGAHEKSDRKYIAHEWGTFTSFQRSNGELIPWHPLESSSLPGFVYNWARPGQGRRSSSALMYTKAQMTTLQRMETPVIYFYSKQPQTVDVEVKFPKGLITEWYPQATQIGPSTVRPPWLVSKIDDYAHKAGVKPAFTFASLLSTPATAESGVRWADVEIGAGNQTATPALPQDPSGSHYFTARETDSGVIAVPTTMGTNSVTEHEKFIFYRGVGNFETPLRITGAIDGEWTLSNTGKEPLSDLFLLTVKDGRGNFQVLDRLASGEWRNLHTESAAETLALNELGEKLGRAMQSALERNGLYPREASAMVHTWKDSWFQEEGVRVLYILPRQWTDRTLPMTLEPGPSELTRVMVGRAEVLSPALEQKLAAELDSLQKGNSAAEQSLRVELKKLGRFAEPALRVVTDSTADDTKQKAWEVLRLASVQPTQLKQ